MTTPRKPKLEVVGGTDPESETKAEQPEPEEKKPEEPEQPEEQEEPDERSFEARFELPLTKAERAKLSSGEKEEYRALLGAKIRRLNLHWAIVCHGNDVFVCREQRCPETKRMVWRTYRQSGFLLAETCWAKRGWLSSPEHRIYPRGFVYDPSTTKNPPGAINLWRGWAVTPEPGDWSLMREHIHEVLAAGNDEHALYIIKWLAWLFQHPEQRAETALVFRGKKGSGRGTLGPPMRALCGQHGVQIYSPKLLTGDFNNHLRDCVFLFADEAMWAGDKSADGKLKGMITEDSLPIEGKGKDAISVINRLHIMMASNYDWVVPATADERRYAVFDTAPDKIGDKEYFTKLNDEAYTKRYVPAMLHDLLKIDLNGWHPRWDIPQTDALHAQVKLGEPAYRRVFRRMLHDGEPINGDLVLDHFKIDCKAEHHNANVAEVEAFAQSVPRRHSTNEAGKDDEGKGRKGKLRLLYYKLADLGIVRKWFDPREKWDDAGEWRKAPEAATRRAKTKPK